MSRRESNLAFKPKKSQFKRWNSRFSAGGANRTSVHDQIRRLNERDESPDRYSLPHYLPPSRLPYDRYDYRREVEHDAPAGEYSPSNFRDGRGRPLQRMGLFRNAKHSDIVMPNLDEQHIRNTEATIRKLTRPERHSSIYDNPHTNTVRDRVRQVVCEMGVPDGYRVYDGVAEVRRPEPFRHGQARRRLFASPPVKKYSNPRQNVLYDSGYEPRTSEKTRTYSHHYDRQGSSSSSHKPYRLNNNNITNHNYVDSDDYYEEEVEEERRKMEEYHNSRRRNEDYDRNSRTSRRNSNKSNYNNGDEREEYSPIPRWSQQDSHTKNRETVSTNRKRSRRKNSSDVEMRRRRKRISSSEEEKEEVSDGIDDSPPVRKEKERTKKVPTSLKNNSFTAFQSPVEKLDKKNESREVRPHSRCSDITVLSRRKMPQYQRENDEEQDSWRQALPFLNDPNGNGAAIVERIGSSMPNLPLTDNSEKCYSKVAFLLIGRSMKNTLQVEREKRKESRKDVMGREKAQNKVFNKLRNMSISWAAGSTILAGGGEFPRQHSFQNDRNNNRKDFASGSIMEDISKIRNPQLLLANGFGLNESIFANSMFFDEETKKKKKENYRSTRPIFHSSPVGEKLAISDEMYTNMPSSIRASNTVKNQNGIPQMSEDSDSNYEFENDMREYVDIDKGASQLTYVHTPEIPPSQSAYNYDFSKIHDSPVSIVQETVGQNASMSFLKRNMDIEERDDEVEDLLKSPIMEDNADMFNFSFSNDEPMEQDVDATTRRIFDNAYNEYREKEKSKKKKKSAESSFMF